MDYYKMWNPRTGESKKIGVTSRNYLKLLDKGWEVLEYPASDMRYM